LQKIRHPKQSLEQLYNPIFASLYKYLSNSYLLTPNPPKGKAVSIDFPETNEGKFINVLGFNDLCLDQAILNKVKLR
jgi:hypothetical protein